MYSTITTKLENHIMTITFNRPESLNSFNLPMMQDLVAAYRSANQDDDVRVIIVTGAGRAFCAGADLSSGDNTFTSELSAEEFRDKGGQLSLAVHNLKKPIIAAINGHAVGIGITMTLPMDIRITTPDAKIGFIFGKRGIGPEACSGYFLPRIVGVNKALEWLYTGRYILAEEALKHDLIQYIDEHPYDKALEIAEQIVTNTSAVSNSFSRQLIYHGVSSTHPIEAHELESRFLHWVSTSDDVKEGIRSFHEKRPPQFPMKASDLPDFFTTK